VQNTCGKAFSYHLSAISGNLDEYYTQLIADSGLLTAFPNFLFNFALQFVNLFCRLMEQILSKVLK